jgi:hypothetical protein
MTLDDIKFNRFLCKDMYFLFEVAVLTEAELKQDPEFADRKHSDIEVLVACQCHTLGREMCRSAMIKNGHFIGWFKAVMMDTAVDIFIVPVAKFFLGC